MNFKTGEIFAIDKPYGITSFKALAHVRYVLSHTLGHRVKIATPAPSTRWLPAC